MNPICPNLLIRHEEGYTAMINVVNGAAIEELRIINENCIDILQNVYRLCTF